MYFEILFIIQGLLLAFFFREKVISWKIINFFLLRRVDPQTSIFSYPLRIVQSMTMTSIVINLLFNVKFLLWNYPWDRLLWITTLLVCNINFKLMIISYFIMFALSFINKNTHTNFNYLWNCLSYKNNIKHTKLKKKIDPHFM